MSENDCNSEQGEDNVCPVCHNVVEIYAVGSCNHFVCYVCFVRMKFLCEQSDCSICRKDLKQVALTRQRKKFDLLDIHSFLFDTRDRIFSEDLEIQRNYKNLLKNSCKSCKETREFETFQLMKNHMSNKHQLYSCDLCFKHLKLFSSERKFYSRQGLVEHKKTGDSNDRSYKGHPLCEFCDVRYFDHDILLSHLRKDHFFCHFCEADGVTGEFYCDYSNLQEHFKDNHYLCEMEQCANVQWSNAFKTDLDLKAHIALEHSKGMSKTQAKQLRNFDLGFNYHSYPSQGSSARGRGGRRGGRDSGFQAHASTDSHGDRGRGGRGGRGSRGARGGRSYRDNVERHEIETAQLLASSLPQGHLGVIDQELMKALQHNIQEFQPSIQTANSAQQPKQESLPWATESAEPAAFQSEFPTLHTHKLQATNARADKVSKKASKKPEATSMAAWLAHSVGRNVRDGDGFNQDFPTLPTNQAKLSKSQAKTSVWNKSEHKAQSAPKTPREAPLNDFPGLHVYNKERQEDAGKPLKQNSSFGNFEVLKKQSKGNKIGVIAPPKWASNERLSTAKSAKSMTEFSERSLNNLASNQGKGQDINSVEGGSVNFKPHDTMIKSKAGTWKKKGEDVEDAFGFKVKADNKAKKGKNKVKKAEEIQNGFVTSDITLVKDFNKEETELLMQKKDIEDRRKQLEEEREKITVKMLQDKKNGDVFVPKVSRDNIKTAFTSHSETSIVPPGFQAKANPPPGFSKFSVSSNEDELPNIMSIPPGFKKL